MTNLESLRSLQRRIREATGPDRELDADICRALEWDFYPQDLTPIPRLTSDPDGLGPGLALKRMLLPEWKRRVTEYDGGVGVALRCQSSGIKYSEHLFETHATLISILEALIAQEEAKEKADDNDTSHI